MTDGLHSLVGVVAGGARETGTSVPAEGAAAGAATATLEQLFQANRDRPWIFIRPGGNWGDHLIYAGAEHLARRCGVEWVSHDFATFSNTATTESHVVFLHGGGGYNSWGSGRPFELLRNAAARDVSMVVQGPQTIEASQAGIASRFAAALEQVRARRIVFFARERTSLSTLRGLGISGIETSIDHDTAFHLDRNALLELAGLGQTPAGRYDLTVMRDDDERPDTTRGAKARGVILDPAYVATSFSHWLRIHLFARTLLTNRLHSAIAGALSGKPVTLAPGSYHKNRSIWEFSLVDRGVEWSDGIRTDRRLAEWVPERLRKSYKLGRLMLLLRGVPLR
jgi:hypothetical protein